MMTSWHGHTFGLFFVASLVRRFNHPHPHPAPPHPAGFKPVNLSISFVIALQALRPSTNEYIWRVSVNNSLTNCTATCTKWTRQNKTQKRLRMIASRNGKAFHITDPFLGGILRSPVNSPHKCQWCGALMFSLICLCINVWVNNREAGDLRRHRAKYDVIVMYLVVTVTWITVHAPSQYASKGLDWAGCSSYTPAM